MPIKIQKGLPAKTVLESENIFVMDEDRALSQDIRPLEILILNLMPLKEDTETQLLRALSNTPLQVDCTFLMVKSHESKNTSRSHLNKFYVYFDEIKRLRYDGMIITGAPLDHVRFEKVAYWDEICTIMEWGRTHVHCTLHLCWGAYAALYHFYGLDREDLDVKLSGVYPHRILKRKSPLFRGFDDIFYAPQSRAMTIAPTQIASVPGLELMAVSDEAGVAIAKTEDSRHFFITCHLEYDSDTLALEYARDMEKGMNPKIPANYFPDDDPTKEPVVNWRSAGQLLLSNWLNYYVYQSTPYDVREI